MHKQDKIFIAGGTGMVGSAIIRALQNQGYSNLMANYHSRQPQGNAVQWFQLDLTDQASVNSFLATHKPDYVFLAAAKVGGIMANNTYPAEFIYDNVIMEANIIHAAQQTGVQKLLFLGSSCIYPQLAEQPMQEEALLTGPLEPTNEPYAVAKIAGIKLCESYNRQYGRDYRSVMPTNLYGPGDNFDLESSHVIPALLRKMHLGKCLEQGDWQTIRTDLEKRPIGGIGGRASEIDILDTLSDNGIVSQASHLTPHGSTLITHNSSLATVKIWGTGTPKREFLHVDDLAEACVYVMSLTKDQYASYTQPMLSHINVGTGMDCTIQELAETMAKVIGFKGSLDFDSNKPDGTPRKLLDVSRLHNLGWQARIDLEQGLRQVYDWYLQDLRLKG